MSDYLWNKPVVVTTSIGSGMPLSSEQAIEDAAQVWARVEERCDAITAERFRQRVSEWSLPAHKKEEQP